MLTKKKNQFNLTNEILEAAKRIKEEQELIGETEAIASLISDWLCEQLEDLEWHYQNSSILKQKIFSLELNTEKLAA